MKLIWKPTESAYFLFELILRNLVKKQSHTLVKAYYIVTLITITNIV